MPRRPATTTLVKANKQLVRRVRLSQIPFHLLPSISSGQLQRLLSTVSLSSPVVHSRTVWTGSLRRFWAREDADKAYRLRSLSDGKAWSKEGIKWDADSRDGRAHSGGKRSLHTAVESSPIDFPFFLRARPITPPPSPLSTSLILRPPSRSTSPTPDPPRKSADTLPSLAVTPSTIVPEPQPITVKQTKSLAVPHYLHDLSQNSNPPPPPLSEDGTSKDEAVIDTGRFIFHVGWSGLPKQRPSDNIASPTPIANPFTPAKLNSTCVGEDAFFQLPYALGIADGVGGWSRKGDVRADPRRWGGLLMHFCSEEIGEWAAAKGDYAQVARDVESEAQGDWKQNLSGWRESADKSGNRVTADPTLMMQKGYEKCLACFTAEGSRGSSTCLLAVLQDDSLHVANLGDCSLFIIRNGEVVHQTTEMQHAFNWPMQLGTKQKDTPMKDAMEDTWKVEKHDIVVMGSDGLTDNLCVDTITDILASFAPPQKTSADAGESPDLPAFCPQKLSEALCFRAQEISEELGAATPFMHKALDNGINFVGGKRDDITVLVGLIGERNDSVQK